MQYDPSGNAWHKSGNYSFERERVFEYSDDSKPVSTYSKDIQRCRELPCLFSYEDFNGYGRVGRISEITDRGQVVDIAYSLDHRFPPIPIHDKETYKKFGCERLECYRTHWAVKNIDLFKTVALLLASKVPDVSVSQTMVDELWGPGSRSQARVFLSHRAKDRKYASKVAEGLRELGHRTFVAHDDIRATKEWRDEILHFLNTMTHFVGLVTDGFHEGSWTDQEIGYSFARTDVKRIFVKLADSDPKGLAGFEQAAMSDWTEAVGRIGELMDDDH